MRLSALSMRDVFPPSARAMQASSRPHAPSTSPVTSNSPPVDEKARKQQELEERYGLSMSVLELVKRYDVRGIHGSELTSLGIILAKEGNYNLNDVYNDQPIAQYLNFSNFGLDAGGGDALAFYQRRLDHHQQDRRQGVLSIGTIRHGYDYVAGETRNVEFLQRLADIHDALQEEKDVKVADEDQLERMRRRVELDGFVTSYRSEPEYWDNFSQETVNRTRQAMQERGVAVGELDTGNSSKEQFARLWQDYQRWEETHPPAARVDVWV